MKILYEDAEVLAIDKPSGLLTHSDDGSDQASVEAWFQEKYPAAVDVGEEQVVRGGVKMHRAGIVHRLDRDTSGVLLLG